MYPGDLIDVKPEHGTNFMLCMRVVFLKKYQLQVIKMIHFIKIIKFNLNKR